VTLDIVGFLFVRDVVSNNRKRRNNNNDANLTGLCFTKQQKEAGGKLIEKEPCMCVVGNPNSSLSSATTTTLLLIL
jgi:hypothetical protein